MGARLSVLPAEDVGELVQCSHFTAEQTQQLYKRFHRLDRDRSGTLSAEELLAIPEFAMNPLAPRLLEVYFRMHSCDTRGTPNGTPAGGGPENGAPLSRSPACGSDRELCFKHFVQLLSLFSPKAPAADKLAFAFRVYDVDEDGRISKADLFAVLRMMVGMHMSDQDLTEIVEKTIESAGRGEVVSMDDFVRCFVDGDVAAKMSIVF